jgi:4-aminobutyrate aminotransferase/(S)-3-amino-2-methylpropionate transaminase
MDGRSLPVVRTTPPGPRSRELGGRLGRVECRAITHIHARGPVVWEEARGANVRDVDGNVFVDFTSGFGASVAGHAGGGVPEAAAEQAARLPHALGDVHPAETKILLLEDLARLAPGDLSVTVLAGSGAEAIEAALKTAVLCSGRPGVLAFRGAYHGLTPGALDVTWRRHFRGPFEQTLRGRTRFVPFPDPYRPPAGVSPRSVAAAVLEETRAVLRGRSPGLPPEGGAVADGLPVGAVLIEPIQGRAGVRVPPAGFLRDLAALCREEGVLLALDEILTGFCRTGRWFACDHEAVAPDLLCVGKALGGGFPLSACVGRPGVMAAWAPSEGEAVHTSTFLGHPVACAAARANLAWLERSGAAARAASLGDHLRGGLERLAGRHELVGEVRGKGLLAAIELVGDPRTKEPAAREATGVADAALERGLIVLPSGDRGNVISLTPPVTITEEQLDGALEILDEALASVDRDRAEPREERP